MIKQYLLPVAKTWFLSLTNKKRGMVEFYRCASFLYDTRNIHDNSYYKFTDKSNFLRLFLHSLGSLSLSLQTVFMCLSAPSLFLTSRLVKTLLYNFIRQEKCPPPSTHIFEPKDEGGLLYGLASGVASKSLHDRTLFTDL